MQLPNFSFSCAMQLLHFKHSFAKSFSKKLPSFRQIFGNKYLYNFRHAFPSFFFFGSVYILCCVTIDSFTFQSSIYFLIWQKYIESVSIFGIQCACRLCVCVSPQSTCASSNFALLTSIDNSDCRCHF